MLEAEVEKAALTIQDFEDPPTSDQFRLAPFRLRQTSPLFRGEAWSSSILPGVLFASTFVENVATPSVFLRSYSRIDTTITTPRDHYRGRTSSRYSEWN